MSQRPWIIIASFPNHAPKAIARTSYKTDAEAHIRFLQRYMTNGTFTIVYDDAASTESDSEAALGSASESAPDPASQSANHSTVVG
jgi:hypothetical protein